ncbi:MAG: putative glycosyltransferase [Bacteroidetes bacterium]|nr:MAG: putative glycosyltransferase [Bacteroidota bacterium]
MSATEAYSLKFVRHFEPPGGPAFAALKLSVIIVNYNVQHFLEQCLHSVRKASKNLAVEVFVVDNNSVDGSLQMLAEKFPEIHLIANKENLGFSKANNQAMRIAKGEYVLLLNPDTVVEEETFEKVVRFMDSRPDAGGLGVMMLDGKGNFLPESKRGLPTPAVAFYKIFGFSKIFPRSRTFGRYHLGYLDKNETHEVEILAGAFMLMRKSVLDTVGLLDEAFFMYGEDIDLSYRIILGGYKNYYFPETRIIHYKGESTKKSSVNYVFVFYNAMVIFAKKHFSQKNARLFSMLINVAVWLRAGAAVMMRMAKRMALPLFDAGFLVAGLYFIKTYYEANIKFVEGGSYSDALVNIAFPAYTLIWLAAVYFSGGYDKPIRLLKIVRGIFVGTGLILIIYALLPEAYRFSRALILLGSGWALTSLLISRTAFHLARFKNLRLDSDKAKRLAIAGTYEECRRVQALLRQTNVNTSFIGFVSVDPNEKSTADHIGTFSQMPEIIQIYEIDEVVFCARDLSAQSIIDSMAMPTARSLDYKIAPPESLSIIGSNSIDTAGDLYVIDINSVSKPVNRRNKRVLDTGFALLLLALFPLLMWLVKKPFGFVANIFSVLFGMKSWVGYSGNSDETAHLPKLRAGVVSPADALPAGQRNPLTCSRLNMVYAKDYKIGNDLNIIRRAFRMLGN